MKNNSYPLVEYEDLQDLRQLLAQCSAHYGNKPAVVYKQKKETHTVSFIELEKQVACFGTRLLKGRQEKRKIALLADNCYQWVIAYLAVTNSGDVVVPIDKDLPFEEVKFIVENSGVSGLLYGGRFSKTFENLQQQGVLHFGCNLDTEFDKWMAEGKAALEKGETAFGNAVVDPDEVAVIIYTSGTTGVAKGVMLSHRNVASDILGAKKYIDVQGGTLAVLPFHHTFGLTTSVLAMLSVGHPVYISEGIRKVLRELQEYKPQNMFVVPMFVEVFSKRIKANIEAKGKTKAVNTLIKISNALLRVGIDMRQVFFKQVLEAFGGNLGWICSGGAPLDPEYIPFFRNFGVSLLNGYGITECSPVVSVNRNYHYCDGSVGLPLTTCEVKIINKAEDGIGEVCVKGDIVMKGYYKMPQATEEAFDDGWFKTGDLGYLNEEGFLFITGRSKNLIILSNGKNIYPEELETLLLRIDGVKEVVVSAEGDDIAAEIFSECEEEPADEEQLAACKAQIEKSIQELNHSLPLHKNIEKIHFRDTEFIKTSTKKIKRHA